MPINESPPLSIKAWPLISKNMCHFPRFLCLGCISVIWSQRRRLMIHHRVKEIHLNGRLKKKTEWTKCGGFWYFLACTGLQVYSVHELKGRIYRWLHSFGNALYKSTLNTSTIPVFWCVTPSQETKMSNSTQIEEVLPVWFSEFTCFRWSGLKASFWEPPHNPFYLTVAEKTGGRGERRGSQVIL